MQPCEKVNILLVDDSQHNLLALEAILEGLGQNLVLASSGEEALKCLLKQDFAAILLDVQMPILDGFETAALIRERQKSKHTPIIFLTAFSNSDSLISKGYALGAVDYLLKPIVPEILRAKVAVFIDLYKKTQQLKRQAKDLALTNKQLKHEISQRKRIEDERANLVNILETTSDFVGTANINGEVLYLNRAARIILGVSENEEISALKIPGVHPTWATKIILNGIIANPLGNRVWIGETEFLTAQGCEIPVSQLIMSHKSPNGTVDYISTIARDISDRKAVEEALSESEECFRRAFYDAAIGMALLSTDGRWLQVNRSLCEIVGYSEQELLTTTFQAITHPDDLDKDLEYVRQMLTGEIRSYEMEKRYLHKQGHVVWILLSGSLVRDVEGNPLYFIGQIQDISDRKRGEEARSQLASIVESSDDAIIGKTLDGVIVSWNSGAQKIYGYSAQEVKGQHISILLPPERFDEMEEILEKLKRGERINSYETVRVRKDGKQIDVALTVSPIHDANGKVTGISAISRDISDRRLIERMKDEFVGVVSHELRTPLTSIRGALGLLAGGLLKSRPENATRMLEIALSNTDRLVRLINDILDIERIESGRVPLEKQLCNIANLMSEASDAIAPVADKAGVAISVSPISAQVWADPDRIIQTLTNLLSNAIKFSTQGSTVWLSATLQGEEILFEVKDRGRGIPENKLKTIFERFGQVDASDSRAKGGTGLGLAICRSIVEQHKGRIWAESCSGGGSSLYFTLPVVKEIQLAPVTELADIQPSLERAIATLILACDDEPAVCTRLKTSLEQRNYHVLMSNSGREAVELATQEQPTAILLNLLVPGMNGWETAAILKERPDTKDIPIILFSDLSLENKANSPHADVRGWVANSLDENTLFHALEQSVQQREKLATVLVVEDDIDLGRVIAAMFERRGIKTFHATTGREAIELSQRITPDLLVLDLVLSESDGFSLVDCLRQHDRLSQIPLVVYSAKDVDNAERERLRLGQTEFLTKGRISPDEFEQRVISLLNRIIPHS